MLEDVKILVESITAISPNGLVALALVVVVVALLTSALSHSRD